MKLGLICVKWKDSEFLLFEPKILQKSMNVTIVYRGDNNLKLETHYFIPLCMVMLSAVTEPSQHHRQVC